MQKTVAFLTNLQDAQIQNIYTADYLSHAISNPIYSRLSEKFYAEYFNHTWHNVSMVLMQEETPIALILLHADKEASYFGQPGIFIINEAADISPHESTALLFTQLTAKLKTLNITKIYLKHNKLLEKIYKVHEITHSEIAYVNLAQSIEDIKKNIRKSYKSLVNWGLKNFDIQVINQTNADIHHFYQFMNFHREVAGRATRNDITWDIQYDMIKKGEAFALIAYLDKKMVSAMLVMHNQTEAYYGVGVYDRALMAEGKPLAHGLLFKAIEICKSIGLQKFILGDVSGTHSAKEENIAKFKSGFTSTFFRERFLTIPLESAS